ncbi:MAG: peptidoglycan DD-metalloendopeptidase family protein, partial [Ginsengibacter sp.]
SPVKAGSILVSSEADKELNASFEKNKGSLPWPVDGYVIYKFGVNELPGKIDYYEQGVNIGTKIGESVKSVFEGEVTLVSYIGDQQAVFIKHGKYFSVYSNLASANVKRGDKVSTGQVIGKAGVNDEGQGAVEFILMKESDFINPQAWLRH